MSLHRYILLFTAIFLTTINCHATIVLTDSFGSVLIGNQLSLLNNPQNDTLNIEQVSNSTDFIPLHDKVSNLGTHSGDIWIKFTISNQSNIEQPLLQINYPILDEIELFIPDSGRFKSMQSGETVPYDKRDFQYLSFVFDLQLPKGAEKTYYLRVKSAEQIILPVSVTTLNELEHSVSKENLLMGIFIGIILITTIYNLLLYFSTLDSSYLYYVAYILFAGLTQSGIEGYNYFYLWPNSPGFEVKSVQIFSCLGGASIILFTMHFLQLAKQAPVLNKILIGLISLFGLAIILALSNFEQQGFLLMQTATALSSVMIIVVSFYILIKVRGNASARIFFVAWTILLTACIIFLLKDANILPYNYFTRFSVKFGTAVEISLLSFALANRINILKKEKENSQQEALRLANENREILRKQNVVLERVVEERTQELHEKNTALQATNEHLKETQTQLVAAEKMSSLGQLTAGIAHEINNPINFVSANINPLKRDVQMLFDTISTIEAIGLEKGKAASVKLLEMAAYKNEQALDELQEEIELLLNGIHDGATRTADIVRGLRLFSRLDEDDWKEANLNDGLQSTLTITGNILKGIDVQTDYGAIPPVTCYPGKLNQVFLNIITNGAFAIRQQHGDNIGGKLSLKTWQEGEFVFVSIKDDGIGMDKETLSKLYEPFFTTKPVGEGTGLGMSIVFTIIQQHHAYLSIWSEPGKGTEFTLKFYIHPPEIQNK